MVGMALARRGRRKGTVSRAVVVPTDGVGKGEGKRHVMKRIRAFLIAMHPLVAAAICCHAFWMAVSQRHWIWLGPLLVNAPTLSLAVWLVRRGRSGCGSQLPVVLLSAWLGSAWTLLGTLSLDDPQPLAWIYTAIGLVGLAACLLWYFPQYRERGDGPRPGQRLPVLTFQDLRGNAVSSTSLRGAPAVLLFHRGDWCPKSVELLRLLARHRGALGRRGARIVLISADSDARSCRMADRLGVPLERWIDPDLTAARQLQLLDPGGTPLGLELLGHQSDTVDPTVIIIDSLGDIRYVDKAGNSRYRSEPVTFLRVLDSAVPASR